MGSIVKPIKKYETFLWFLFIMGLIGIVYGKFPIVSKVSFLIGGLGLGLTKLAEILKI